METQEQQEIISQALIGNGASRVGFGDVSDLPAELTSGLPVAISIVAKYGGRIANNLEDEPAYHAHLVELLTSRERLMDQALAILKGWRFKAAAVPVDILVKSREHLASLRVFPHKTAATRAGLGWIGKSALLITPEFGPRLGLATVLTNAPFKTAEPVVSENCGECRLCVDACPYGAIHGLNWKLGISREELFDPFLCNDKRAEFIPKLGRKSNCGLCIQACPIGRKKI